MGNPSLRLSEVLIGGALLVKSSKMKVEVGQYDCKISCKVTPKEVVADLLPFKLLNFMPTNLQW